MTQPSENRSREERINEAIAAYLRAAEAGQSPPPEQWLAEHADLADELRSFLSDRAGFRRLVEDLPTVAPAANVADAPTIGPGEQPGEGTLGTVRYFGDYDYGESNVMADGVKLSPR